MHGELLHSGRLRRFVVVGLGHIGDLLSTGGSGVTAFTGIVTYVTPIDFLLKSIKDWVGVGVGVPGPTRYLNAHPQPGLGAVAMLSRSELWYGERWSRPVAVALCFLTLTTQLLNASECNPLCLNR